MNILTPLQQKILKAIGGSSLQERFYLTGGTALSAFYLQHRYSEDLDFFTPDPAAVSQVSLVLTDIAQSQNWEVTFTRILGTFLECFITGPESERVKLDFAQDSPYRLEATRYHAEYNIYLDEVVDIGSNKLSALFDRAEPKDFVDVYFLCQELMPFSRLEELTKQKYVGIDDYWLAIALRRVTQISLLPRMIKPVTIEELNSFFLPLAEEMMERLE